MSRSSFVSVPGLDAFKALAAQLIVLHHLAYYGPLPEQAWSLAPDLFGWLANHARIAVQLFIVLAGFLAAHTLAPEGRLRPHEPLALLARRYLRLVLPFLAALVVSILCAGLARGALSDELVPAAPSAGQFLAHAFLLHNVLGVDALSAGAWYVAIDLQLFAIFVALMHAGEWLARHLGLRLGLRLPGGPVLVMLLGVVAMFHFNRDARWDAWGLYFFGSYALGVFARWALAVPRMRQVFALLLVLAVTALWLDYRSRLLVATLAAVVLLCVTHWQAAAPVLEHRVFRYLARVSYSLFLIHFAVLLLLNTIATELFPASPALHLAGLLCAWALANVAAHVFHRNIEAPALRWCAQIGRVATGNRLAAQER